MQRRRWFCRIWNFHHIDQLELLQMCLVLMKKLIMAVIWCAADDQQSQPSKRWLCKKSVKFSLCTKKDKYQVWMCRWWSSVSTIKTASCVKKSVKFSLCTNIRCGCADDVLQSQGAGIIFQRETITSAVSLRSPPCQNFSYHQHLPDHHNHHFNPQFPIVFHMFRKLEFLFLFPWRRVSFRQIASKIKGWQDNLVCLRKISKIAKGIF